MSIRKFTFSIALILLTAIFVSDRRSVVSQKSTVTVTGRVRISGIRAIPGVWVSLIRRAVNGLTDPDLAATLGNPTSVIRVKSDADGHFQVDVPAGNYDIRAYEAGFQTFSNRSPLVLIRGQREARIDVDMEPTTSIAGSIERVTGA
jgi:hypothetical protein